MAQCNLNLQIIFNPLFQTFYLKESVYSQIRVAMEGPVRSKRFIASLEREKSEQANEGMKKEG